MKLLRIVSLLLALLTAFTLVSCGASGNGGAADSGSSAPGSDSGAPAAEDGAGSEEYDYSYGIGADGFIEGVRALDTVGLPAYVGIEVPASEHEVSETELRDALDAALSGFSTDVKVTNRAVVEGDLVNIDYVGSVDGVEFAGGNTNGQGTDVTAGAKNYIDDFLDQIIGVMPGETVNVEVTFPDPYPNNTDLSGKDAVFVTTVNYITEKKTPELTDEFVMENLNAYFGWTSAVEVRDYVRDSLTHQKVRQFIKTYLTGNALTGDIPAVVLEQQRQELIGAYTSQASQNYMSLLTFLRQNGFDSVDAFVESQKDALNEAARQLLILQAIAEDAGITLADGDVDAFIEEAFSATTDDQKKQVRDYFGDNYLAQSALDEKVLDYIETNAVYK